MTTITCNRIYNNLGNDGITLSDNYDSAWLVETIECQLPEGYELGEGADSLPMVFAPWGEGCVLCMSNNTVLLINSKGIIPLKRV